MKKDFDAVVVLGGGIQHDGTLPNHVKLRLDKAVKLWKDSPNSLIITSGKWSIATEEQPEITEAESMKRYLLKIDVPEKKVLKEEKSQDTVSNAFYLKTEFLIPNNWKSLRVVTSDYHLQRTKFIFKKVLGKKYDIEFIKSPSGIDKEILEKVTERQDELFSLFKRYFGDVKDGDHRAVEIVLKEGLYYKALIETRTPFIKKFVSRGRV